MVCARNVPPERRCSGCTAEIRTNSRNSLGRRLGRRGKFLAQVIATSFWSGAAIITIGFFASLWIQGLYGALFVDDQLLLGFYMLSALPYLVVNSIGSSLLARDQQWYWLLVTLVHQFSVITSGFLMIGFGAAGSAFALLGSGVLFAAMAFHRARKLGLVV